MRSGRLEKTIYTYIQNPLKELEQFTFSLHCFTSNYMVFSININ